MVRETMSDGHDDIHQISGSFGKESFIGSLPHLRYICVKGVFQLTIITFPCYIKEDLYSY